MVKLLSCKQLFMVRFRAAALIGQANKGVRMPTLTELKEKVKEMEQAADRLLQVTKELREVVSVPWIK